LETAAALWYESPSSYPSGRISEIRRYFLMSFIFRQKDTGIREGLCAEVLAGTIQKNLRGCAYRATNMGF
jgi:hypothetical protein